MNITTGVFRQDTMATGLTSFVWNQSKPYRHVERTRPAKQRLFLSPTKLHVTGNISNYYFSNFKQQFPNTTIRV